MANQIALKVTLDDKGAVQGVEKITKSVEGLKKADAGLDWKGTEAGGKAARESNEGYTVLKGTLANLASTAVTAAVGGIKDAASAVVEIGSAFETSMSKVSALSGATGDDLAALEAKARELGSTTTFSASQAADALGYMALAGWDTQSMLAGVGPVLSLAQAGELDLAAASDLVTDYLSAFNMTAEDTGRMVDVLAYAQANANTTVDGLGQAFKNCAANCNAAGMDVETTSAAIAMMANQGLKGSEAGTALNAVMRDMTQRMEDGSIKIGDATVAVMDAQGNYRDFADILADVESATDGMGDAEKAAAVERALEGACPLAFAYRQGPRLGILGEAPEPDGNGPIVIAAAGTSDLPVAEEAAVTAEMLGNNVVRLYDVGVAGIHRLLAHADDIARASVVVAVAGMEGALPSVVGGLASCPVIAVPTSVGYGASFGGVAALLAMLNSCASGVSVVNIDNGFGAGYQAHMINHVKARTA